MQIDHLRANNSPSACSALADSQTKGCSTKGL
jgi:hypothetical protein